jgi:Uncharacterised nucleotidyltransferase
VSPAVDAGSAATPTDGAAWRAVRAAAAHGLAGAPPIPEPRRGDELSWARTVRLAESQRVLGLLAAAVSAGALSLDDDQFEVLANAHEGWCAHDLRLERALARAADALDAAAIPYLLIKGPALAHGWYPDPSQRLFADLDLVVSAGSVRSASAVLGEVLGATPPPELRPGYDERFGKETLLRTVPSSSRPVGLEIDVHRTPVAGAFGLAIPLDELFVDTAEILVGGRAFPTTGPVATLMLACYQATVADVPPRLAAWRDVVQLLDAGVVDEAGSAIDTAARWQASAVLADAVAQAGRRLDLPTGRAAPSPSLTAWAEAYQPDRRSRLLLAAHRRPGYVYWRQLAGVVVLDGWRDRAGYLRALVSPQSDYLTDRRWTWTGHLRRAWRSLSGPVRHRLVAAARGIRRHLGRLD